MTIFVTKPIFPTESKNGILNFFKGYQMFQGLCVLECHPFRRFSIICCQIFSFKTQLVPVGYMNTPDTKLFPKKNKNENLPLLFPRSCD